MPAIERLIKRIRRRIRQVGRDAGWKLGFDSNRFNEATGSRILVYHGICLDEPLRYNTLFIKKSIFEQQLGLYKKYFNLVSLDEYYERKFTRDRLNICLSFDDGFANNYKYVLPLLETYEIPATFFITSVRKAGYDFLWNDILGIAGREGPSQFVFDNQKLVRTAAGKFVSVETGRSLNDLLRGSNFEKKADLISQLSHSFDLRRSADEDYWMQMTVEQIRSLSASRFVNIGSHGFYHNDLAKLSIKETEEELVESKNFLEDITGKKVKALAFPYGSYSKETLQLAKRAGYDQLLATDFLWPDDRSETNLAERLTVNPFISPINQMHAIISGHYD